MRLATQRCTLVLLAVTLPVACSPRNDAAQRYESELRMKAQCAEAGKKARGEWIERYKGETFSDNPEYGYNSDRNTCLYADEYIDVNSGEKVPLFLSGVKSRRDRFVLDVYADKVLVEYTEHDGNSITTDPDPVMCRTEQEFEARKAKLFGHGESSTN